MVFDLDTGFGDTDDSTVDCAFDECLSYEGGSAAANYTVDLGELTLAGPNVSGVSAMHSDGDEGEINYIFFDLATNAASGAAITMESVGSRPGYLDGPGTLTEDIVSVADGDELEIGVVGYGWKWAELEGYTPPVGETNTGYFYSAKGDGASVTTDSDCISTDTTYCAIDDDPLTIFSISGSIEGGRGKLEIGASINGTMVPGTYTDTLQFIATATY
jgi:hypothetical protein